MANNEELPSTSKNTPPNDYISELHQVCAHRMHPPPVFGILRDVAADAKVVFSCICTVANTCMYAVSKVSEEDAKVKAAYKMILKLDVEPELRDAPEGIRIKYRKFRREPNFSSWDRLDQIPEIHIPPPKDPRDGGDGNGEANNGANPERGSGGASCSKSAGGENTWLWKGPGSEFEVQNQGGGDGSTSAEAVLSYFAAKDVDEAKTGCPAASGIRDIEASRGEGDRGQGDGGKGDGEKGDGEKCDGEKGDGGKSDRGEGDDEKGDGSDGGSCGSAWLLNGRGSEDGGGDKGTGDCSESAAGAYGHVAAKEVDEANIGGSAASSGHNIETSRGDGDLGNDNRGNAERGEAAFSDEDAGGSIFVFSGRDIILVGARNGRDCSTSAAAAQCNVAAIDADEDTAGGSAASGGHGIEATREEEKRTETDEEKAERERFDRAEASCSSGPGGGRGWRWADRADRGREYRCGNMSLSHYVIPAATANLCNMAAEDMEELQVGVIAPEDAEPPLEPNFLRDSSEEVREVVMAVLMSDYDTEQVQAFELMFCLDIVPIIDQSPTERQMVEVRFDRIIDTVIVCPPELVWGRIIELMAITLMEV